MGGRYKEICDEIVEAMPTKTKRDKIMEFLEMSLNALWILGAIAIIKNLIVGLISETTGFNFILTDGDIIAVPAIILIANAIVWYVTKTAFDIKKVAFLKIWLICIVIFSVLILSSIFFRTIVVSIPLWLAAIIVLFIYVICKIVSERA